MSSVLNAPAQSTLSDTLGKTPLVALQRLDDAPWKDRGNLLLAKLEGNNPAGSVKDRPAFAMITGAEQRGEIRPGDTLIEATSGNTGIALAMVAAMRGYRMVLIMPDNQSVERRAAMSAYGATLILTPADAGGMEYARDLAMRMQAEGQGRVLNQFANPDNPRAHYETTGPELWQQTQGRITHFVSAMGTTGTITGVSRYLKEQNPSVSIVGVHPAEGAQIAGIRKWPVAYQPAFYEPERLDRIIEVSQLQAETMARRLASEEGIFCGVSAGGAAAVALELARELRDAVIVFIACDRGDRYLSTGLFDVSGKL